VTTAYFETFREEQLVKKQDMQSLQEHVDAIREEALPSGFAKIKGSESR
jgi:hypothetical protein